MHVIANGYRLDLFQIVDEFMVELFFSTDHFIFFFNKPHLHKNFNSSKHIVVQHL